MPLGTEVGLGPGHIVLDGGPSPIFRLMSIAAKRLPMTAIAEACKRFLAKLQFQFYRKTESSMA